MAPLDSPRQKAPEASDQAVHRVAPANKALDRDKEPETAADKAAEAVSTAIPGRNRTCCPSCSLESAGVLHGCHLGSEIVLFNLDTLAKGVAGESTHFHVLADLASGLFHKISHGERAVLNKRLLHQRKLLEALTNSA